MLIMCCVSCAGKPNAWQIKQRWRDYRDKHGQQMLTSGKKGLRERRAIFKTVN
ncbi:Uncharacterised protein [Salmonella enterica subsp. enterica]|nr:Uncharacterised protein [Salmonella enterica subsp. enterica]